MNLHYFHGRGPLRVLVMGRGSLRLELFIKQVSEQAWGLVILAGTDHGQPERQRCQGPWTTLARAESALRSAAGTLMASGYEARPSDYAVWSVAAQRVARTLRAAGPASASQSTLASLDPDQFDPLS